MYTIDWVENGNKMQVTGFESQEDAALFANKHKIENYNIKVGM